MADVDVSKESDFKPTINRIASRRVVKKKVTISTTDNIIPDPDVTLELGKSISLTEAAEEEAARQVHATHARIMTESVPEGARRRPSEQEAIDTMQALKESKKTSRRQPCTGDSSKGTGGIIRVSDESTVVSSTSSEGTGTIPGVLDEENVTSKENVILDINLEITDDEENEDEFVQESGNGDVEIFDAAKAYVGKTEEVKDDAKKAALPPTSSSLSVSLDFGDQFFKLSSDTSLIITVKDTTDAEINFLLDIKIQNTTDLIQKYSVKPAAKSSKIKKPTIDLEQESEKTQKEYDLKSALYQTVHKNKSFNRNLANHAFYHALMEALIEDENAMDKGVADTVKNHKRQHDDDNDDDDDDNDDKDPSAGPNQGKKIKRRRTKESESSKKTSTTGETSKVNIAGEDMVCDDDQPQVTSKPKTYNNLNQDWFKQPSRPPTPNPKWNKRQVVLDEPEHLRPTYNLLKGTCTNNIELKYNFQECFNALTEKLDWNNPEGDHYPLLLVQTSSPASDIIDFIVPLHMFTRSLIIKRRVEDIQLGVESYQKKLNITAPQKTFPEIKLKELHTPSYKPPGVIYEDLNKHNRVIRTDELYKFLDGTLETVRDELHHRILDFPLGCNDEMSRRKWMAIDNNRLDLMVELIDKQIRKRWITQNLKRLVSAPKLKMDYKLMTRTV
nr:hypothetical protein [Tanacetum cinerariifolium]